MLRIEKIFERDAIEEELAAYNPLIPDGRNWKATFMLEYDDPAERSDMLAKLVGVEDCVWMRVGAGPLITPVCDEDLERATGDKTSSVHFMRFELSPEDIGALETGRRNFRRHQPCGIHLPGSAHTGANTRVAHQGPGRLEPAAITAKVHPASCKPAQESVIM